MTQLTANHTPAGTCYDVSGQGDPLVLIHGVGLDKGMWCHQVDALAQHFQVITYDMLGHGSSTKPAADASLNCYANQLDELLQHLNISSCRLIGFSMGGLVARAFALKYSAKLDALVILNSVFKRTTEQRVRVIERAQQAAEQGPDANVEEALLRWFSDDYRAAHPEQINAIHQQLIDNDPQGYVTTYQLFATQDCFGESQLDQIKVPTLVVTGELDPGSTPEMAEQLASRIPDAQCVILKGQRHMMPMESPDRVNQLLLEFLHSVQLGQQAT